MKISIKLKHTELTSLVDLMETMITDDTAESRADAIIHILVCRFYKKLVEKTFFLEPRIYRFGVEPEVALAFIEFFSMMPVSSSSHAGNIADKLIREFDQFAANIQQTTQVFTP